MNNDTAGNGNTTKASNPNPLAPRRRPRASQRLMRLRMLRRYLDLLLRATARGRTSAALRDDPHGWYVVEVKATRGLEVAADVPTEDDVIDAIDGAIETEARPVASARIARLLKQVQAVALTRDEARAADRKLQAHGAVSTIDGRLKPVPPHRLPSAVLNILRAA